MGLFKGFRARTQAKFERELGATPDVAALGALAMHPFVGGSPRPESRELTKLVSSESREFASAARTVKTADELLAVARPYVQRWHWAARHFQDDHYVEMFAEALSEVGRDGDNVGQIFGRDPYLIERMKSSARL